MKNESNRVADICLLSAKAEPPALKGHIQGKLNRVEGNLIARDTMRCADARSDLREHSVFQCNPLQGQTCFRCLCLVGHPMENSRAFRNNHLRCQAGMAVNATPESFSLGGETINKFKI
jgi:hypothetical protein